MLKLITSLSPALIKRQGTDPSTHYLDTVINLLTAFIYKSNCQRYSREERTDHRQAAVGQRWLRLCRQS